MLPAISSTDRRQFCYANHLPGAPIDDSFIYEEGAPLGAPRQAQLLKVHLPPKRYCRRSVELIIRSVQLIVVSFVFCGSAPTLSQLTQRSARYKIWPRSAPSHFFVSAKGLIIIQLPILVSSYQIIRMELPTQIIWSMFPNYSNGTAHSNYSVAIQSNCSPPDSPLLSVLIFFHLHTCHHGTSSHEAQDKDGTPCKRMIAV
jgi:hypothetical protein